METSKDVGENALFVICRVDTELWAIACGCLREMLAIPEVTRVPEMPAYVRGVFNLRGTIVPALDLRVFFGMSPLRKGMADMLAARKQDHVNWLNELDASVKERRPFRLTTDPHKCKFGLWYDAYRPESIAMTTILRAFDAPHQRIHRIGAEVVDMTSRGDYDDAAELVEQTRDKELLEMINLFDALTASLFDVLRETAVVIRVREKTVALTVDSLISVEPVTETNEPPSLFASDDKKFLKRVGRRQNGETVLVLDEDELPV